MMVETDEPFIFSSALKNPNRLFSGYCFSGRDYIWGHGGAEKYEKETGRWPSGSEDGCYASIVLENDGFLVRPDFWGYKKIYFYYSANYWAFSDSLKVILENLSSNGISLPPSYPVLQSILAPLPVFRQVFSFELIAEGLQLLPSGCELHIGRSGARVSRLRREKTTGNYQDALSVALETWVCRFETLLTNGNFNVISALSGGLDSRTVFSILHRAKVRTGLGNSVFKLHCGSIKGDVTDLKVAQDICDLMNLPLNAPMFLDSSALPGSKAVDAYEKNSLGVYHPLYLPRRSMHPRDVYFGGEGGENYRPFYRVRVPRFDLGFWKSRDPWSVFASSVTQRISSRKLARSLESMLLSAMRRLKETSDGQRDPLMLHYQNFRNRFHAGRAMEQEVHFCPLASGLMDEVACHAGEHRLRTAQIYYDIMYSLEPSLLGVPFNKASKNPSEAVLANLTRAEIGQAANPGRVFIAEPPRLRASSDGASALEALLGKLDDALVSDLPGELFGPKVIADARNALQAAMSSGRFHHSTDGVSISAVLAAGLFR